MDWHKYPSVPWLDRFELPEVSGVYLVVDGLEVVYVGQSENICKRVSFHDRACRFPESSVVYWKECKEDDRLWLEIELIRKYKPRANFKYAQHSYKTIKRSMESSELAQDGTRLTAWRGVFTYRSKGINYYRFMAGVGDRIDIQKHIPGGRCGRSKVEARASEVGRWVSLSRTNEQIMGLINGWK